MISLARVQYKDINLKDRIGTLVKIEPTEGGGDCSVIWDAGCLSNSALECGECMSNLIQVGEQLWHTHSKYRHSTRINT